MMLSSLESFVFGCPLYDRMDLPDDMKLKAILWGSATGIADGHCVHCNKEATFRTRNSTSLNMDSSDNIAKIRASIGLDSLNVYCARAGHQYTFYFLLGATTVMKVGQLPSVADISQSEFSKYRKVLSKVDSSEIYKAIGLAAHGVGIGAFVYLRRVFERLIQQRFEQKGGDSGVTADDFKKLRMSEKISTLSVHLPSFLVENREIYSILSQGIHELDERTCLGFFDVMKHSTALILEEDARRQEEDALRSSLATAIKSFGVGG